MKGRNFLLFMRLALFLTMAYSLGIGQSLWAQSTKKDKVKVTRDQAYAEKFKKISPSEQKKAAKEAAKRGLKPGVAGVTAASVTATGVTAAKVTAAGVTTAGVTAAAAAYDPGSPHYFGPYGNWAFSPLPRGPIEATTVTIVDPGTGYTAGTVVNILDAYGTGSGAQLMINTVDATGAITGVSVTNTGTNYMNYSAPVVDLSAIGGGDAIVSVTLDVTVVTGGMQKFVDLLPGIPGVTSYNTVANGYNSDGSNKLNQYLSLATADKSTYLGSDYYEIAVVEYTEKMHTALPPTRLRGYVQLSTAAVPGLGIPLFNPDGSKVLMPDGITQAKGVDKPHYLGPIILAQGKVAGMGMAGDPKPARIKFYNLLPNSANGGNLFLPVDETVPGAGIGPALPGVANDKYSQNRATIHLHGNNTVWISDGNTHQWISPASETTPYPAGVSARNVPDMGAGCDAVAGTGLPGDANIKKSSGCMTFYYTNAQSARLQFYHDHAHGITRLNVYAGEAAGYVVTDAVEQDMINGTNFSKVNVNCVDGTDTGAVAGDTPGECARVLPDYGIPLVIQDRTWVDASTIYAQDPTWAWGTGAPGTAVTGDLWYPHVYMTVTNPWDPTGTNPFGRWFYGPWFNPPTPTCIDGGPVGCIEVGPVPNPYYGTASWEPPFNPGVPNPSIPGESFLDTPIVNGTAYPVLKVEPKAYRFRILNASNDRAQNLQLYVAADKTTWKPGYTDTTLGFPIDIPGSPTAVCNAGVTPANCTEVKMVPVIVRPANQYADTPSGIPDPATAGPSWIQIGTEGGFTPAPVVIPQQPIGYNLDPAYFNFGIVNQHSLFLMAAERADVIVDFSAYRGKTLILYNDSPAPVPAGAAPYDNYTGDGNLMDSGGAPNTLPGYGPNTRTIMQIQVADIAPVPYNLNVLNNVFAKASGKRGVFEVSQDPIIIPQTAYNSAYNQTFPTGASQYILNIGDTQKNFQPLGYTPDPTGAPGNWNLQPAVTIPFEMKAMHDEMGGVYDTGFGRMSGMLGLTNPNSALGFILPFPYSSPPTDIVKGSLESTKIGQLADGTQLWRIFHNGVDTHPIHTHLFTAQVISRVGQDGQVAPGAFPSGQAVDAQNVGWKDTVYINPLEITFLALRPTVPTPFEVPFELPNSKRLIDPVLPEGATLPPPGPAGWFDPNGNPIPEILNHVVNFGWEYVWHCHILSHEEMDFMHSLVFAVPPLAPTNLTGTWNGNANNPSITLNWTDNSTQEAGFTIQRALDANFTNGLTTVASRPAGAGTGTRTYTDTTPARSSTYYYRVLANGELVGDTTLAGFPTMSADSFSNPTGAIKTFTAATGPSAPTLLTATGQAGPQVMLTWRDNAINETGFRLERCTGAGCIGFALIATVPARNNTGSVTYVDTTVAFGNTYRYRVLAFNGGGNSAYAPTTGGIQAVLPAIPAAPTSFNVRVAANRGNTYTATLNWAASAGAAGYTIQRANNLTFTTGLATIPATGTTLSQIVNRNSVYYYRIRANNSLGGSSAWTNASPFPIRTGP
jgi:FtsP/CotA-like multicopper oxidase with cupredoxin domain